ncbi:hypothetical protein PVMG_04600 [Plasmodium vivax Mauritania I]|uniref:Variable surface protein n=1 Tax=Plasmodium vivax Mauritania I TaxID=1035515 RepID=A0A0J9T2Y6_PLAVI|nr:hypothetical protein PVMG_04600 [Plasmodium vivax Mauritania I]
MYNEFDSHVDGDINERHYDVMCDHIVKISNGDLKKHKNVCMKLMRNLGHRSGNSKFLYPTHDRCNVLYNWIYNSINKHSIPRNVIIKCYDDYTELKNVMDNKYICPYYSFDDIYEEPINIIMLKIFESNVDILISTLNDESNSFISSCQNYVCELVKIYNIMNSRYCPNVGENDIKRKNTCEILKTFKRTYMFYLFDKLIKKEVIPSLHDVENEYKNKCIPSKPKVPSNAPRYDNAHELQSSTGDIGEKKNDLSFQPPLNSENPGSSISSTVSTAVGTMAGASSILALLYKVNTNFHLNV